MFRLTTGLLVLLLAISCGADKSNEVSVELPDRAFRHLDLMINIKNEAAKDNWTDFNEHDLFQPIVYFTKQGTFVINPNDHIRKITDHQECEPYRESSVILLSKEHTDTINFHFYNSYEREDTNALYYKDNVLYFQSFDLTKKFIPDIVDLQDWSIMVIHELFHGFQRSIPGHSEHFLNIDIPGGPDEFLGSLYEDVDWFAESIKSENDILKSIWIDNADLKSSLLTYDSLRDIRIERVKQERGIDIRHAEDYEIMIEGHARYFESVCKRYLAKNPIDTSLLVDTDRQYITGMFDSYVPERDQALSNLSNSRYYYPIGYNISMILEQHLPQYSETLYRSQQDLSGYLHQLKYQD